MLAAAVQSPCRCARLVAGVPPRRHKPAVRCPLRRWTSVTDMAGERELHALLPPPRFHGCRALQLLHRHPSFRVVAVSIVLSYLTVRRSLAPPRSKNPVHPRPRSGTTCWVAVRRLPLGPCLSAPARSGPRCHCGVLLLLHPPSDLRVSLYILKAAYACRRCRAILGDLADVPMQSDPIIPRIHDRSWM